MARAQIADPAGGVGERLAHLRRPARDALVAVGVLRALHYVFVQGIRPWEFAGVDARAYWGIDIAHLGTVTGFGHSGSTSGHALPCRLSSAGDMDRSRDPGATDCVGSSLRCTLRQPAGAGPRPWRSVSSPRPGS